MKPSGFCRPHAEHMVDRPDVDTPQGAQPTGTNGRRQHNTRPHGRAAASTRLRTRPAAIARTATGDRTRNTRPPSGPQTARKPRSPSNRERQNRRFAAVMAWGRRPVPFRTRKLRPSTAMVLHPEECGRVAHRRHNTELKDPCRHTPARVLSFYTHQHKYATQWSPSLGTLPDDGLFDSIR